MPKKHLSKKYDCYAQIKTIIEEARSHTYKQINFIMVQTYWNIGRIIVKEEQQGKTKANYGQKLLEKLSKKLTKDFGKGFDSSNLWNMRKLYLTFPILDTLCRELSWSHYRLLMRVENKQARQFYATETTKSNWSVRALERQINSFYFERLLSSENKLLVKKEAKIKTKSLRTRPEDIIKDPYILDFLHLKENESYTEKEIEQALLDNIQKFLLELGRGVRHEAAPKSCFPREWETIYVTG